MITLPAVLQKVMDSKDLNGLKPFAVLFRNKWIDPEESGSESGESAGGYVLDTLHPIDISAMITKPNTLSMTLDVNEVAQYNANNVTLTLSDPENRFLEGTPNSYFPDGYQLYGSRVVLYYGVDNTNKTSIFTGVIKELPTHKPETYQVDLKLVSPLEMLKDIEAKDFSDKVTGEELHYEHQYDDSNRVYSTAGTGVGGFDAVYADGVKLFEGVDYEVSQTNKYGVSALITILSSTYSNATITADYYTWKTGLTVEQIVAGLVALGGYDNSNEDIQKVVWTKEIRTYITDIPVVFGLGYYNNGNSYVFNWFNTRDNAWQNTIASGESRQFRKHIFPTNFETEFTLLVDNINYSSASGGTHAFWEIGTERVNNSRLNNGMRLVLERTNNGNTIYLGIDIVTNGSVGYNVWETQYNVPSQISFKVKFRKIGTTWKWYINDNLVYSGTKSFGCDYDMVFCSNKQTWSQIGQVWRVLDSHENAISPNMFNPGIFTTSIDKTGSSSAVWGAITSSLEGNATAGLTVYFSNDNATFDDGTNYDLKAVMARSERYLKYLLYVSTAPSEGFNIVSNNAYYLDTSIVFNLVNLSGKTVLEALQDFALISGYEFGVNREGVFFFRPRVQSTTPNYTLGGSEVVKVDTVKRNLNDFFTKLTLTFATVPLEFYANTGTRPTPIDRYGVINKEIDKPEIVNYDNPELAQAIGPQLLEIYSALPNVIQATGKLNLALELGDIVNLKRNYQLTADKEASDYNKFERQDTYYRACKITGMNYNFAKRQITYTLRDVSNSNNSPLETADLWEFVYDFPIRLGVK